MLDNQAITELTNEDKARLAKQRKVIERFLGDEQSLRNYETVAGKLGLLQAILDQHVFHLNQKFEWQCTGVVLGDALVQELGMQWIMVEGSSGRGPALSLADTTIVLYPLTMISKHIEKGQMVDVFDLFNNVAAEVGRMRVAGC